MQQPQSNQPGVSTQMQSVYMRGEQLNNQAQSSVNAQRGAQFNLRDTNASQSTWQYRQRAEQPIEDQPTVIYVPDNNDSFAPPANLNQLQRIDRPEPEPQTQQPLDGAYIGEIYKSPIDLYRSRTESRKESLSDSSTPAITSKTDKTSIPQHDTKTNGSHGFVSRELPSRMFFEHTESEEVQPTLTADGRPIIRLKSQPDTQIQLLKQSIKSSSSTQPAPAVAQQEPAPARLLIPDFEAYQGCPQLDSPGQPNDQWSPISSKAIEQATQQETGSSAWITYSPPQPAEESAPPAAIFQQLAPPAPPVEEMPSNDFAFAARAEPVAPPAFEAPVVPPSARVTSISSAPPSDFVVRSDAADFKPVSSVRVVDQAPTPKFNFETHRSWAPHDETSHVASTIQPGPVNHEPLPAEVGWLSPWWILVGLIPFALYVAFRGSEEENYEDYELSRTPALSPEMLNHPGYSKSDPVYGKEELVMAVPILRSVKGTSNPTNMEVDQNASPNFRPRKKRKG